MSRKLGAILTIKSESFSADLIKSFPPAQWWLTLFWFLIVINGSLRAQPFK